MLPGHYVDPAENYELTAEAWATKLDAPFAVEYLMLLQSLFSGVTRETLDAILIDPPAFSQRVQEYRYAIHGD